MGMNLPYVDHHGKERSINFYIREKYIKKRQDIEKFLKMQSINHRRYLKKLACSNEGMSSYEQCSKGKHEWVEKEMQEYESEGNKKK